MQHLTQTKTNTCACICLINLLLQVGEPGGHRNSPSSQVNEQACLGTEVHRTKQVGSALRQKLEAPTHLSASASASPACATTAPSLNSQSLGLCCGVAPKSRSQQSPTCARASPVWWQCRRACAHPSARRMPRRRTSWQHPCGLSSCNRSSCHGPQMKQLRRGLRSGPNPLERCPLLVENQQHTSRTLHRLIGSQLVQD